MLELDLAGDPADFVVLNRLDRLIRSGDRKQTIEQRELLLTRRDLGKLAGDNEVLGAAVIQPLGPGDADDERRAIGRELAAFGDEALDERRFIIADVVIGPRNA